MTEEEVLSAVDALAEQINRDFGINDRILLVGVLKGAFMVMADLVRRLHSDTEVEFVRAQSVGKSASSPGTVSLVKDIGVDITNRHVIIVEEIIDSGRTLKYLHDRLKSAKPLSIKVATLLDKRQKRIAKIDADYVGRLVDDQFLIGYGLDLEEKCRNLRNIYALRYPN